MRILFGVFDWGLGHATRDTPLITAMLEQRHEVHILSTGHALQILRNHFGERCTYHDVPSVYPPYTKSRFFKLKFTLSAPRMARTLAKARRKSKRIIDSGFDRVVSDCRYDVYDRPDNSYLINHQLRFKAPIGAQRLLERWLAMRMKRYAAILVPDFEEPNLTGVLSHQLHYLRKDRIRYIGMLSHLRKLALPQDIDYLISLSGPEPQRTILEKRVLAQVGQLKGRIIIAGGRPGGQNEDLGPNVQYFGFLNAEQQQDAMNRARFIVTRSGYTTMMELVELEKTHVLLLPTPGQTEQEYLGDYCEKHGYYPHINQFRLQLGRDARPQKSLAGFPAPWKTAESVARALEVIRL
jgi:uncharacterized protein (TIGR00661 family)